MLIITCKCNDSTHSRGVSITFNKKLDYKIQNVHRKQDGRVILVNCLVKGVETTLCCVYAPSEPTERKEFLKTVKFWIARNTDYPEHVIMGGDFNCGLNANDRSNTTDDPTRAALKNLLDNLDLTDSWYITNNDLQYTFADDVNNSLSRIDYIFVSKEIRYKIKSVKLKQAPKKDKHLAVCLNLKIVDNDKGPGYWKLNAKLLELPEFDFMVKRLANDARNNYHGLDGRMTWEVFKFNTQEGGLKMGKARAKMQKEYINRLQKSIDDLNKRESNGDPIDTNEKTKLNEMLNKYYDEKHEGYMIRSKCKWVHEGERSTKFFFNLEKTLQGNNIIKEIKDKDGNLQKTDNAILKECALFYENLFSSKNVSQADIDSYLNTINIPNVLNNNQKAMCDNPITEKEIKKVIDNLKPGKSPGCDGLTTEFYKKYWPDIKDLYLNMINETYQLGELPYTLRKAILALLFKKGDTTLLKNYRPISLTNYDYKILCFTLSNRLQEVLKDLINDDQTGYIKGRYIGTNARLLQDYFEHCENFQIPGILLLLDFEKAFDSIEWNFMLATLRKFNFGEGFVKWITILYTKPIISIKNNGWLSEDIELKRGVRQGCPLSALLFVLAVEIMAIAIRQNNQIKGFKCGDTEIKESLYADDTSLLLSDLTSLEEALNTINKFSMVAGPKLNIDKTEGILLGPLKNTLRSYMDIKFTNEAIRCLGIFIGHDKIKCHEKNWTAKLDKIKIIFERWKSRHLSIFGKNLIIKSLASSILIHTMSILDTPEDILKEIEKLIFDFLWDKNEKIKRKTLISDKKKGGIDMLDIYCKDKSLKAAWLKRIKNNGPNKSFINMYLNKLGIDTNYLIKTSATDPELIRNKLKLPLFWAKVFAYANECKQFKSNKIINNSDLLSEPIWLNKRFYVRGKPIFVSNWTKSGILYVKDLYGQNGYLINEREINRKLQNKSNWIAEYSLIKKIFKKVCKNKNMSNANFINIKNNWSINIENKIHDIENLKSNFYYKILVENKSIKNYMESEWEKAFEYQINWNSVYQNQVWQIKERKLGEFNYKLLCNILYTKDRISKFNKEVDNKCKFCNQIQNVKHLLYDCPRVENLWKSVGAIIKLNIKYKHLIVGSVVCNETTKYRNLLISYIAYGVYKFWIMAENNKINFNTDSLHHFIKKDLFGRSVYLKDPNFDLIVNKVINNM